MRKTILLLALFGFYSLTAQETVKIYDSETGTHISVIKKYPDRVDIYKTDNQGLKNPYPSYQVRDNKIYKYESGYSINYTKFLELQFEVLSETIVRERKSQNSNTQTSTPLRHKKFYEKYNLPKPMNISKLGNFKSL